MLPLSFATGPIYAVIFWSAFALWIGLEIIAGARMRSHSTSSCGSTSRDRGSLNLVVALWTLGIASDLICSLHLPQAAIPTRRPIWFFVGIALILFGVTLRWYAIAILGKYFTFDVAIHKGQTLVQSGPYRHIRHPSYTGALLSLLGFGLALGNWGGLVVAMTCLGLAYSYRIPVEESALTAALGEAYIQYRKRTRRLIPFLF